METTMTESLETARRLVADHLYETFSFDSTIVAASGWSWEQPGTEMTRPIFVAHPSDPSADSDLGHFTVRFEDADSFVPVEAYAIVGDAMIGQPGQEMDTVVPALFPDAAPKL
jgi:hypothetical protein